MRKVKNYLRSREREFDGKDRGSTCALREATRSTFRKGKKKIATCDKEDKDIEGWTLLLDEPTKDGWNVSQICWDN